MYEATRPWLFPGLLATERHCRDATDRLTLLPDDPAVAVSNEAPYESCGSVESEGTDEFEEKARRPCASTVFSVVQHKDKVLNFDFEPPRDFQWPGENGLGLHVHLRLHVGRDTQGCKGPGIWRDPNRSEELGI